MSEFLKSMPDFVRKGATALVQSVIGQSLNACQNFKSVRSILKIAVPGDILEIHRIAYSHYALYVGGGYVMNIAPGDHRTTTTLIQVQDLHKVCNGSRVRVRNHDEEAEKHFSCGKRPIHAIMQAAYTFSNKFHPYELDFRNCEFYCTLWRYGVGFSTQVAKPSRTQVGLVMGGIVSAMQTSSEIDSNTVMFREGQVYHRYKTYASTGWY